MAAKTWRGAAGVSEKPVRERSVGFTDASYIRQDDAPNTPRCYSFAEEQSSGTKKTASPLCVGALCLAFFVLGSLLTTALSDAENGAGSAKTAVTAPLPESAVAEGSISGTAEISAAAHADTPPTATSAPAGGRAYLGVIVQTVSCAAAEYYNRSDSNAMVPGVQVYAVEDGGPASVAGLCSGDVIIRLDGADIATAADLTAAENGCVPGGEAVLTVYRNGEYKKIPVVFGRQPEADGEEDEAEGWCDFDNAW